jgi:hypothetical protein
MTRTETSSNRAEILTIVPSYFSKNLLLLAIYLALWKSYRVECKLIFKNISDSALLKNIFENNICIFSLAS